MEAVSSSETAVSIYQTRLHGAASRKTVICISRPSCWKACYSLSVAADTALLNSLQPEETAPFPVCIYKILHRGKPSQFCLSLNIRHFRLALLLVIFTTVDTVVIEIAVIYIKEFIFVFRNLYVGVYIKEFIFMYIFISRNLYIYIKEFIYMFISRNLCSYIYLYQGIYIYIYLYQGIYIYIKEFIFIYIFISRDLVKSWQSLLIIKVTMAILNAFCNRSPFLCFYFGCLLGASGPRSTRDGYPG
jgi:hypothetical protein